MIEAEGLEFEDCILGLDLATTTGWAALHGTCFVEYDEITFARETRLREFRDFIIGLVTDHRPALVVAEEAFIHKPSSAITLIEMHGVLKEVMSRCICPLVFIGNTEAKKDIGGNGAMTAKDKKNGAMIRALNDLGFVVSGTDAADALAIALTMRMKLFGRIH